MAIEHPSPPKAAEEQKHVSFSGLEQSHEENDKKKKDKDNNPVKQNTITTTKNNLQNFILPKCHLPPKEEFEPIELFVASAVLESDNSTTKGQHANKAYKEILKNIRKVEDPPMVRDMLLAFCTAQNGAILHKLTSTDYSTEASVESRNKYIQLRHLLFKIDPFHPPKSLQETKKKEEEILRVYQDYTLADAYLHLIVAIVTSNTTFLQSSIQRLWFLLNLGDPKTIPFERTQRIHATLATLTRLCPKMITEIFPYMVNLFPFYQRPADELLFAYQQCFTVLNYVPTILAPLMQFVVHKCLEMDVEIKIQDGGQVILDDEENDDEDLLFSMEDIMNTPSKEKSKDNSTTVDEMAEKLDSLMLLTFEHMEKMVQNHTTNNNNRGNGKRDKEDNINDAMETDDDRTTTTSCNCIIRSSCNELYSILAPVFGSSIITTHKSKFVQFLLFYLCGLEQTSTMPSSLSSPLYRDFAATLIDVFLDPFRASSIRQSAVCYLASFTSRATYVCPETVCESLCALFKWAEEYMKLIDKTSGPTTTTDYSSILRSGGGVAVGQCHAHALFYTVCQATFYIMCFRGKEAIDFYRSAVKKMNAITRGAEEEEKEEEEESNNEKTMDKNTTDPTNNDDDDEEDDDEDLIDLEVIDISAKRWRKLCCHKLQPLRYCLESVRSEFLIVSQMLNLFQLDYNDNNKTTIMSATTTIPLTPQKQQQQQQVLRVILKEEYYYPTSSSSPVTSNRLRKKKLKATPTKIMTAATIEKERRTGGVGGLGLGTNPLDSFFPFDPYLLRNSYKFIEPLYNHWNENQFSSSSDTMGLEEEEEEEFAGTNYKSDDNDDDDDSSSSSAESSVEEQEEGSERMILRSATRNKDFTSGGLAPDSSSAAATGQEVPREPWTNVLKRARAPSIEAGSW